MLNERTVPQIVFDAKSELPRGIKFTRHVLSVRLVVTVQPILQPTLVYRPWCFGFNPCAAEYIYLNFLPLEAVSRYRDPQPQVLENYLYLVFFRPSLYKC